MCVLTDVSVVLRGEPLGRSRQTRKVDGNPLETGQET
jgi:hypothetical protein